MISLSGPSKSGKTVFIEKNIGKDRLIQVTGAGITEANKLWDRVFDIVGTPVARRTATSSAFEGTIGGKIGGEAGVLISANSACFWTLLFRPRFLTFAWPCASMSILRGLRITMTRLGLLQPINRSVLRISAHRGRRFRLIVDGISA